MCRGKGYATEASRALVAYGFKMLGVDKICAYIESNNTASSRVAEKAGLKVVSTFPGYRMEELWLEMQKSAFDSDGYDMDTIEFSPIAETRRVSTKRLVMRDLEPSDCTFLFKMDSDPRVFATLFG